MTKHEERPEVHLREVRVLDGQHRVTAIRRVLKEYDATALVGLRTRVHEAAIEHVSEEGEQTIELPKLRELLASAATVRRLMPVRLRGAEIKTIRRILQLTLAELAKKLDERTAPETVSRWESESQPMGGYAERLLRLIVCESLKNEAHGVEYDASMIAELKLCDPWKSEDEYEVPYVELALIHIKERSGSIIEAWDAKIAA